MTKYWEIVQLKNGSFALQSSESKEEPLVRIEFSDEAKDLLQEQLPEVARAMIGVGMEAASFVSESTIEDASTVEGQIVH